MAAGVDAAQPRLLYEREFVFAVLAVLYGGAYSYFAVKSNFKQQYKGRDLEAMRGEGVVRNAQWLWRTLQLCRDASACPRMRAQLNDVYQSTVIWTWDIARQFEIDNSAPMVRNVTAHYFAFFAFMQGGKRQDKKDPCKILAAMAFGGQHTDIEYWYIGLSVALATMSRTTSARSASIREAAASLVQKFPRGPAYRRRAADDDASFARDMRAWPASRAAVQAPQATRTHGAGTHAQSASCA